MNADPPPGWKQVRLGDVADIAFSGVDKKTVAGELPVRLCNYTDVFYNRRLQSNLNYMGGTATLAEIDKWSLREDDVLFTKDSETPYEIGIPSYVTEDMPNTLCGYHLGRARPKPQIAEGAFLAHAFGSHATTREFSRIANGITRFGLTLGSTRSLPLLLPPLPEQRAIATVLDSIDEAIERTEEVIAVTESVRDALRHELLTRGLPGQHKEWKEVPGLKTLPASWQVKRLGELASLRTKKGKPAINERWRYVGLEHIEKGGSLIGRGQAGKTVSHKTFFCKGDILYGKLRPNLRKVVRVNFDGVCSTEILAIFASKSEGSFLSHLLRSDRLYKYAMRGITGTRMPRTSWKHLQAFEFGYPSPAERQTIVAVLDNIDSTISRTRSIVEALKGFKSAAADALLNGKTRTDRHFT